MNRKRWFILVALLLVLGAIGVICGVVLGSKNDEFPRHGVPILSLQLNGVSIEEIDGGEKTEKYEGNSLEIIDGNQKESFKEVEVKGRGNGTWAKEKKPYRIKFDQRVNLFGMGKARKWYLLANSVDNTFLRNETAFKVAEMLGMEYYFEGKYVELYIDGDYRGLYYLTHAMEINKNVVDLRDSFGLLVELDNYYGRQEDYYETRDGDLLVIKDLVDEDNRESAMKDFLSSFNALEEAIEENNYEAVSELIDVRSFAQYYLLSEFSVNPDAYWTSCYFYKDGMEDVIHAGPGWDFDLAFGNRKWVNWMGERFYSPYETMIRRQEMLPKDFFEENGIPESYDTSLLLSKLYFNLMEMPEFKEEVRKLFMERLSGREMELLAFISNREKEIKISAERNGEKWENTDFTEAVSEFKDWVIKRYRFFEQEYGVGASKNSL